MPDHAPVIVSITTIPSRIGKMRPVLQSLLDGELRPDAIYVNVPEYCVRQKSSYDVPAFFDDADFTRGVIRINRIEKDWGPGTKLLGPIDRLPDECYLVIADDDVAYHLSFLDRLIAAQRQDHASAFSYYTYRVSGMPIGQGCDGLSVWSPHLDGVLAFAEREVDGTSLLFHDDIWISFFLATRGVRMKQVPVPTDGDLVYEQIFSDDALRSLGGENERQRIVREHLPRLFRNGMLPSATLRRFQVRAAGDTVRHFAAKVDRKLRKVNPMSDRTSS